MQSADDNPSKATHSTAKTKRIKQSIAKQSAGKIKAKLGKTKQISANNTKAEQCKTYQSISIGITVVQNKEIHSIAGHVIAKQHTKHSIAWQCIAKLTQTSCAHGKTELNMGHGDRLVFRLAPPMQRLMSKLVIAVTVFIDAKIAMMTILVAL